MPPPTLVLTDNFQYGEGYQGGLSALDYITGRINTGDEFTLKITFTASRDFEASLHVGLVDQTEAADWWTPLSWPGDPDDPDEVTAIDLDGIIKEGQTIAFEVDFTAIASASGNSATANRIVFQTDGDGVQGTLGSGVKGPVTLTFTRFEFSRKGDPVEPEPEFDLAALRALPGGIVLGVGGTTPPVWDATNRVVSVSHSSSSLFHFTWEAAGFDAAFLAAAGTDLVRITYAAIIEDGEGKTVVKSGANSWSDLSPAAYPAFVQGPNNFIELAKSRFDIVGVDIDDVNGISFQHNIDGNPEPVLYHVKILGVTIRTP
jgi:hypothetical protein